MFFRQRRRKLAEFAQLKLSAQRHRGRFQEQFRAARAARVNDAAQAELLEQIFRESLEVGEVALGVALVAAPESWLPAARQREGDAAFFLGRAIRLQKHPANLEQRDFVVL